MLVVVFWQKHALETLDKVRRPGPYCAVWKDAQRKVSIATVSFAGKARHHGNSSRVDTVSSVGEEGYGRFGGVCRPDFEGSFLWIVLAPSFS